MTQVNSNAAANAIPPRPQSVAPVAPGAPAAPAYGVDERLASDPALDLAGLTAEEARFVQEGWLPKNFAALRAAQREGGVEAAKALARQGVKGPFSRRYGDPNVMLDGARRISKHPEFSRMMKQAQPGDILVTTYNKDNDVISVATKGPFVHALVCVSAHPPEFIEAIGMTGDVKDPDSNKVLRSQMGEQGYDSMTYRLMRPTANLSPHEADKAIKRAIAYCEAQLGKPYDYTFTDTNTTGMNDAFYCSELAYKAYAHPKGADLPFELDKSPERDVALKALSEVLDGLDADDQGALAFKAVQLNGQKASTETMLDFLIDEVLPHTAATRAIANTPERRAAVEASLRRVLEGKAFQGFSAKLEQFSTDERSGRFKGVGGFFRRVGASIGLGWNGIQDVKALTDGVGFFRSLGVSWKLVRTLTPHMETLCRFFFGEGDPRTVKARQTLDTLDGLARDAHRFPLVGQYWPLPSRPRKALNNDFVSPTDLAWAHVTHWDFNVKPETPVDKPAVEARKR